MARRKSSRRGHRSRRTKHNRRRHTRRVRRTRRTRRGGDGSIGSPYPASRIMPLNPNQTLDGRYFSRSNQIGGRGGVLQPTGSMMNVGGANGQMATQLVTGGRA
jgi:hypothetical protein